MPTLEYLEVLEVGVFGIDIELDSGHRDIKKDAVKDLAEGSTAWHIVSRALGSLQDRGEGAELTQSHTAQPW